MTYLCLPVLGMMCYLFLLSRNMVCVVFVVVVGSVGLPVSPGVIYKSILNGSGGRGIRLQKD